MNLTGISLFSGGADGIAVAIQTAGIRVIAHVEINPFCREVLQKNNPGSLILEDVKDCGKHNLTHADVIFGGPPCQPYSSAGSMRGEADDRHLWPEMYRIIRELKPAAVLFENVANATNMVFPLVRSDLEAAGYKVWAFLVPASSVGAPHKRERLWVVAYADQFRRQRTCAGYGARDGEQHDPAQESAGRTELHATFAGCADRRALGFSQSAGLSLGRRKLRPDAPLFRSERSGQTCGSGEHRHSQPDRQQRWDAQNVDKETARPTAISDPDLQHAALKGQLNEPIDTGEAFEQARFGGSDRGIAESRLGGSIDGLPDGLDFGGTWPGFPAPLGMEAFDFEPPRTVGKGEIPNRAKRVALLGNAVVPQQAYPFARAIRMFLETGD